MDSLLAIYGSSDDDEEEAQASEQAEEKKKRTLISTQLAPPKWKPSLFSTLPPPKTQLQIEQEATKPIFSSLPTPKSQSSNSRKPPAMNPNPKRVVQFTLPLNPSLLNPTDFDDDEEEERGKAIKKDFSSSAPSNGLNSMLPAPKNSLCLAPTATSRRPASSSNISASKSESFQTKRGEEEEEEEEEYGETCSALAGSVEDHVSYPVEQGASGYGYYPVEQGITSYDNYANASYDGNWAMTEAVDSSYATGYTSGGGGGGGGDYGNYLGTWSDGRAEMAAPVVPEMERIRGKKRGRNEIPEMVEVNQAELMKDRPREDQVKVTGIAFGPAYQPVSTSKGKPSKLHKRKHQIGSLYFDMKQKETELAERRAKGFLTKAETQAKYGW